MHRPTASDLVSAYAAGDSDPVAATRAALEAVERLDDQVNAVLFKAKAAGPEDNVDETVRQETARDINQGTA